MSEHMIPEQHSGGHSDTVSETEFATIEEAAQFYETARLRLFNVNAWNHYSGLEKAKFILCDHQGHAIDRQPQKGDYFRMEIPVPDNDESEGDDWVIIEEITDDRNTQHACASIRVHTTPSPLAGTGETAHFYGDEATSTFIVKQVGHKVVAEVHGRNIKPNTKDVSLLAKVRNALVAIGGMIGGSKIMWKSLTNGLVSQDK